MSAENEPAADPGQFLREVANADEGWSERYGGPEGIARWTLNLQDALKEQASDLAAVRTAAIREDADHPLPGRRRPSPRRQQASRVQGRQQPHLDRPPLVTWLASTRPATEADAPRGRPPAGG